MQETPTKPVESKPANELTPEKQSTSKDDTTEDVKTNSATEAEVKKIESDFKTPEKSSHSNQSVESLNVKENSTPVKVPKTTGTEFKTPEKSDQLNQSGEVNDSDTPKKPCTPKETNPSVKENSTPLKERKNTEAEFKTPEKSNQSNQSVERKMNETPGKTINFEMKLEQSCDGEDGMISTTEQARLLIAASKTPSKSVNRTPVKQNTPSGKRSIENSPITPGKHRRVELITLASPKAKRLKQI